MGGIGPPFCFHVIPTYRVLSHSMITTNIEKTTGETCTHTHFQVLVLFIESGNCDSRGGDVHPVPVVLQLIRITHGQHTGRADEPLRLQQHMKTTLTLWLRTCWQRVLCMHIMYCTKHAFKTAYKYVCKTYVRTYIHKCTFICTVISPLGRIHREWTLHMRYPG